jgi:hypothetical protein
MPVNTPAQINIIATTPQSSDWGVAPIGSPSVLDVNASVFAGSTALSATVYGTSPPVDALNVFVVNGSGGTVTANQGTASAGAKWSVQVDNSSAIAISGTVSANCTQTTSPWVVSNSGTFAVQAAISGSISNTSFIATQSTGTNLHTVVDSGSITATCSGTITTSPPLHASTNVDEWNGTAVDTNSGNKSTGTLRVVLATDQPALTNKLLVTADPITFASAQAVTLASTTISSGTVDIGSVSGTVTVAPITSPPTTWSVSTTTSQTANAPSQQSVSGTFSSILAANANRKECIIVNTGTATVYLGLGQTPTATAYHIALSPCTVANDGTGGVYISDIWLGAINAIVGTVSPPVSGTVCATELT